MVKSFRILVLKGLGGCKSVGCLGTHNSECVRVYDGDT